MQDSTTRTDPAGHLEDLGIQHMLNMDITNKTLLIREDLNVPIQSKVITHEARLIAAMPTIKIALERGAKVVLMSHLGRPKEGEFDEQLSLQPIADYLSEHLNQSVPLIADWQQGLCMQDKSIVLLENIRFNVGEKSNDEALAKKMASLCDIFVMDAFGTAHRAQASTEGVARFAPQVCAGPLLVAELQALNKALIQPQKPIVAVVGGAKVSSKLSILSALAEKVDYLIVGGGIANTFLAAKGYSVGKSLYEPNLVNEAKKIMQLVTVPIPQDVVTATEFSKDSPAHVKPCNLVNENEMILDIGPNTGQEITKILSQAGTIIWNGPLGVFEFEAFSQGTRQLAISIAQSTAFSIAGGGDTLAAIDTFKVTEKVDYISTGGGAFLEFIEGKTLPAVAILKKRALAGN